jgi:hypothetical protein
MQENITTHFNDEDIQVIAQAPVLVFLLVSAADGTIDEYEIKCFESLLTSPPYHDLLSIIALSRLSITDTLQQLTKHSIDYRASLRRINHILDTRLAPEQAQQIKQQLCELAQQIAAASEIAPTTKDNPINDKERIALKVITGLFGVKQSHH